MTLTTRTTLVLLGGTLATVVVRDAVVGDDPRSDEIDPDPNDRNDHHTVEGDDTWIPWLVNHAARTSSPGSSPSRPGKNIGYTDWTHR